MSAEIKGVLFDLDSTLIDWRNAGDWSYNEHQHLQLVHTFLAEQGRPLSGSVNHFAMTFRDAAADAWEGARSTLIVPQMLEVLEAALDQFGFTPDETITMRDIIEAYEWGDEEGVEVYPDVPDALQTLIDMGIKIGIVTNAWQPMWMRDKELHHHDLLRYFPDEKIRISAADVGYLKPHPKIFEHALEQLGTKAENTLFVGDNPAADIDGAQGLGMRAILRVNNPKPPLISELIVPDSMIRDFGELLLLVEDWDQHKKSI